jgi:hypothetical protein
MTSLFIPIDARSFGVAHGLVINGRHRRVACNGIGILPPRHHPGEGVTRPT